MVAAAATNRQARNWSSSQKDGGHGGVTDVPSGWWCCVWEIPTRERKSD
ncbi:hypothetical protein I553_2730 [Mycobacterium xenopi 4042]|uniref:Uncharacterized protein n=1 Tax=Mycobacterium xenopi 4042 TaxID=1299334 RepID=X7YTC3_MYCXE|nr:hypothetical protein I553_2730 [Mycobacterium xenopi 4042]